MRKLLCALILVSSLGLVGCATIPKKGKEAQDYTPKKDQPATAQEYWQKREAEDATARKNAQARGVTW